MKNSEESRVSSSQPNGVRLDSVDREILRALSADAKLANNVLAARINVAPSTCLARVKALQRIGILGRAETRVDLEQLGYSVFALVALQVRSEVRSRMNSLAEELSGMPCVMQVFMLSGDMDFLIHVGALSTAHLRELLSGQFGAHPDVASIKTSLIFDHREAPGVGGFLGA